MRLGLSVLAAALLWAGAALAISLEEGHTRIAELRQGCMVERMNAVNEVGRDAGQRREAGRGRDDQIALLMDGHALQLESAAEVTMRRPTQRGRYFACMLNARAAVLRASAAGQFETADAALAGFQEKCGAEKAALLAEHDNDFLQARLFEIYGGALQLTEVQLVNAVTSLDENVPNTARQLLTACVWRERLRQAEGGSPPFPDDAIVAAAESHFAADVAALQARRAP